jgi:hypothetical protein
VVLVPEVLPSAGTGDDDMALVASPCAVSGSEQRTSSVPQGRSGSPCCAVLVLASTVQYKYWCWYKCTGTSDSTKYCHYLYWYLMVQVLLLVLVLVLVLARAGASTGTTGAGTSAVLY